MSAKSLVDKAYCEAGYRGTLCLHSQDWDINDNPIPIIFMKGNSYI